MIFFQDSGHNLHSVKMESCFIFTAFYICDHIPEWKQNIKVKKKYVPPQSWSSSGTLTGLYSTWQMCSRNFQWVLFHFCPSLSFFKCFSLSIYSQRENIPRVFFPFFETCGGSRRRQNQASLSIQFFGTGWAFFMSLVSCSDSKNSKQLFHNRIPGSCSNCTGYMLYTVCARKQIRERDVDTVLELRIQVLVRQQYYAKEDVDVVYLNMAFWHGLLFIQMCTPMCVCVCVFVCEIQQNIPW